MIVIYFSCFLGALIGCIVGYILIRAFARETVNIKIKYVSDVKLIKKIKQGDWIDLRSAKDMSIRAHHFYYIPLGVAMELPAGYEAHVEPRSSTLKNYGLIGISGIVDNTFKGDNDEWCFICYATHDTYVHKNDRICQFRIVKNQPPINFRIVETLGNKDRGGWGSTGK